MTDMARANPYVDQQAIGRQGSLKLWGRVRVGGRGLGDGCLRS